jgi:apolipoprotein N-acyltransferase
MLFWHLLAGAFASLSLPPLFLLPAIFALSIPLLAYLKAESRMQASMIFGAAGTGWFLASTYWVSHSLIVDSPSLWVLAPFLALALALILAVFWASAAMVSWSFGRRPVARLFWFVAFFSLGEWARGFVATGFPWNLTGSLFAVDLASLQVASVIGAYGLCVIALFFALVPAFWVLGHRRFAAIFLMLPLVLAAFGAVRLANSSDIHSASSGSMVRLVQPAIPQADKWDRSKRQRHLDRLVNLSRQGDVVPKLVIWPETAFCWVRQPQSSIARLQPIRNATQNDGVVITGIPRFGGSRTLLNSAIMIDHDGAIKAVYDKRHLVPFGEYMPFREMAFPSSSQLLARLILYLAKIIRLMRHDGYGSMQMLICYEVIFAGAVIGQEMRPDIIINITNDAWFRPKCRAVAASCASPDARGRRRLAADAGCQYGNHCRF